MDGIFSSCCAIRFLPSVGRLAASVGGETRKNTDYGGRRVAFRGQFAPEWSR